jgi:hypothetical protein
MIKVESLIDDVRGKHCTHLYKDCKREVLSHAADGV